MIRRTVFVNCIPLKNAKCSPCTYGHSFKIYRNFSDSITYSGGHASSGQGGFYGSGGSRASHPTGVPHHPELIGSQRDIQALTIIVNDVLGLENELRGLGSGVSSKSIEIKAKIKKLISNPQVREILNRLEVKGSPVWGLSAKERDLVRLAKDKYMAS